LELELFSVLGEWGLGLEKSSKGGSFVWQPTAAKWRVGAKGRKRARWTDATDAKTCQRSMGSRKPASRRGVVFFTPLSLQGGQNLMTAKLDFEGACAQKQQQNKANKKLAS